MSQLKASRRKAHSPSQRNTLEGCLMRRWSKIQDHTKNIFRGSGHLVCNLWLSAVDKYHEFNYQILNTNRLGLPPRPSPLPLFLHAALYSIFSLECLIDTIYYHQDFWSLLPTPVSTHFLKWYQYRLFRDSSQSLVSAKMDLSSLHHLVHQKILPILPPKFIFSPTSISTTTPVTQTPCTLTWVMATTLVGSWLPACFITINSPLNSQMGF